MDYVIPPPMLTPCIGDLLKLPLFSIISALKSKHFARQCYRAILALDVFSKTLLLSVILKMLKMLCLKANLQFRGTGLTNQTPLILC